MEPNVWTTGLIVAVMLTGLNMCAAAGSALSINKPLNCSAQGFHNCSDVVNYQKCALSCLKTIACKDPIHMIQYYTTGHLLKTSFACPDDEVYELGKAGALVKAAYPGCAEVIVSCQHPLAEGMRAKKSANTAFPKEELCALVKKEADCESEVIMCKCGDRREQLELLYSEENKAMYGNQCGDLGKVDPETVRNKASCLQSGGGLDVKNRDQTTGSNNSSNNANSNAVTVTVAMPVLVTSLAIIPLLLLVR